MDFLFSWLVPQALAHHNMRAVIDTAKEFRCFEDFDYRNSRQKIDHCRQWYRTRMKNIKVESFDELKERYVENNGDMDWDVPDERSDMNRTVLEPMGIKRVFSFAGRNGQTNSHNAYGRHKLEKIAETLGYKTHSAVHKRIRKIICLTKNSAAKILDSVKKNLSDSTY